MCGSAAPLRLTVGNSPTPLDPSVEAGALVSGLFNADKPAAGKGKRKKEEAGKEKKGKGKGAKR